MPLADVPPPQPSEVLHFPQRETSAFLYVNPTLTFPERHAKQDNTDVSQGPPTVASRPMTRLKAKQAPEGEIQTVVHEACTIPLQN